MVAFTFNAQQFTPRYGGGGEQLRPAPALQRGGQFPAKIDRVAGSASGFGPEALSSLEKKIARDPSRFELLLGGRAGVGGTWLYNTYPGCACDVPSHLYSFSFAPNPDWSETYSPQPEIHRYLRRTAEDNRAPDRRQVGVSRS